MRYDVYLSVKETAELLGEPEAEILRRIEAKEILGYIGFEDKMVVPKRQFIKRGKKYRVMPGMEEIIDMCGGSTLAAWGFLLAPNGQQGPVPLVRLKCLHKWDYCSLGLILDDLKNLRKVQQEHAEVMRKMRGEKAADPGPR